jgi:hypothetical protein
MMADKRIVDAEELLARLQLVYGNVVHYEDGRWWCPLCEENDQTREAIDHSPDCPFEGIETLRTSN